MILYEVLKAVKFIEMESGCPGGGDTTGDGELLLFNEDRVSVQGNENSSGGGWTVNVLNATELYV